MLNSPTLYCSAGVTRVFWGLWLVMMINDQRRGASVTNEMTKGGAAINRYPVCCHVAEILCCGAAPQLVS